MIFFSRCYTKGIEWPMDNPKTDIKLQSDDQFHSLIFNVPVVYKCMPIKDLFHIVSTILRFLKCLTIFLDDIHRLFSQLSFIFFFNSICYYQFYTFSNSPAPLIFFRLILYAELSLVLLYGPFCFTSLLFRLYIFF